MRQMAGNLFGQDPEPPSLNDGPHWGACPLDNRLTVENLLIGDNVTLLRRSHDNSPEFLHRHAPEIFTITMMSAAIDEPDAEPERLLEAVSSRPFIGIQSCFQCYCTHLAGSCQGKQEHAAAEYEYASRSTRCFLTYARLRRCAGVR